MKNKMIQKTKKVINLFLAVLMLSGASQILSIKASAQSWTDETQYDTSWYTENPEAKSYQINNAEELAGLAYLVNNKEINFEGKEIILTASIDFSESTNTWEPIGVGVLNIQYIPSSLNESQSRPFKGIFNGNNQTIKGIKTDDQKEVSGLFGVNRGTIKNIGVINSEIKGKAYVGGVAGWNEATIENSYNTGSVSSISHNSDSYAGGVAGYNSAKIENSCNKGSVSGNNDNSFSGGVAGWNEATIENSYNAGSVSSNGQIDSHAGGVAGLNDIKATIENSYNKGPVTGSAPFISYTGGVVGYNHREAMISNIYNTGSVSSNGQIDSHAGGVAGYNDVGATILNSYNSSLVISSAKFDSYAGGVAGWNESTIENSYNTGSVSSISGNDNGNSYAGGVAGWNRGKIKNSYYNTDSPIDGKTICEKDEGKTTAEMKDAKFAKELGSAFMSPKPLNLNEGLPVLKCFEEIKIFKSQLKNVKKKQIKLKETINQYKILSNANKKIRVADL